MNRSRFAALRRAVETGSYRADPERIAAAIISRALAHSSADARGSRNPTLTAASINIAGNIAGRFKPGSA